MRAFLALALVLAPAMQAQTAPVPSEPAAIGPWHSLQGARAIPRDNVRTAEDVLRVAEAEVVLGRPDRARALLELNRVSDRRVEALAAFGAGDYARAGSLFAAWAEATDGETRGVYSARAGDSFERAGLFAAAAASYRAARAALPGIAGWLALREARVSADTVEAFSLLEAAPQAGRLLIPAVRGELLARFGDTARAVAVLAGAGYDGRAARLALASGDSAGARQVGYRAIRSGDTAAVAIGLELARNVFPPVQPGEFLIMARAVRRESPGPAAELVSQAVAHGDGTVATLILLGDLRTEAGSYDRALEAYQKAADAGAPESVGAQYSVARTLLRLARPLAAARAVSAFLQAHPTHPLAPMATFLQSDLAQDAGRRAESDSLSRVIVERWPSHDYASQARLRLAGSALVLRDTAGALRWYRQEVDARGPQQTSARYSIASLAESRRDTVAAASEWRELARVDSLGYFGAVARERAGLPLPVVAAAVAGTSRAVARNVAELDLLDAVGFAPEAAALISWLLAEESTASDALDFAEALIDRGRTTAAISLGWRASRTLTLNHPRVLRAIYPWPLRPVVLAEAKEFGLDEYLMAALIRQESSFDPLARSRAGARGLMQVMPGTARQAAMRGGNDWSEQFLRIPDANIHVGAAHLAALLRHYGGDVAPTLAAYNAGMTPVERWRRRYPGVRDPVQFTDRIPYAETRGYVRTVLRNWSLYRILYPPVALSGAGAGP